MRRAVAAPAPPRAWMLAALDLVFPAVCPVCDVALGAGRRDPLCGACWSAIARLAPPWCLRCGLPFPTFAATGFAESGLCQACATAPPRFAWARAAALYEGALREALHAFKFGGRRALARPLAALIVETLGPHVPDDVDALVPVPLGAARERDRGFNQAVLLAERLAAALAVPVGAGWLHRTRPTAPQTELSAAERRANVRGAFAAAARARALDRAGRRRADDRGDGVRVRPRARRRRRAERRRADGGAGRVRRRMAGILGPEAPRVPQGALP